jgi:hypothetical protein
MLIADGSTKWLWMASFLACETAKSALDRAKMRFAVASLCELTFSDHLSTTDKAGIGRSG